MRFINFVLISLCLTYSSCVTFKQYDSKAKNSRDNNYEAFIVKTDGKIIGGEVLKHRNYDSYDGNLVRVINKDNAFTIDGKNYSDKDVIAFQDKKAYHKRFENLFLIRLVKGKINLYYFDNTGYTKTYTFSNGPTTHTSINNRKSTFYFEKGKGEIIPVGISELKEAIQKNVEASDKLNKYYPKDSYTKELNIEKIVEVINLYNQ